MIKKFILRWLLGEDYIEILKIKDYILDKEEEHKKLHLLESDTLMEVIPNYYPIYLEVKCLHELEEWVETKYKVEHTGFFTRNLYLDDHDREYYEMKKQKIKDRIAKLIANVSKEKEL